MLCIESLSAKNNIFWFFLRSFGIFFHYIRNKILVYFIICEEIFIQQGTGGLEETFGRPLISRLSSFNGYALWHNF